MSEPIIFSFTFNPDTKSYVVTGNIPLLAATHILLDIIAVESGKEASQKKEGDKVEGEQK